MYSIQEEDMEVIEQKVYKHLIEIDDRKELSLPAKKCLLMTPETLYLDYSSFHRSFESVLSNGIIYTPFYAEDNL